MSKYFIGILSIISIMNEELNIDPLNPPILQNTYRVKLPIATLTLGSLQQWVHATGCIKSNIGLK